MPFTNMQDGIPTYLHDPGNGTFIFPEVILAGRGITPAPSVHIPHVCLVGVQPDLQ